MPLHHALAKSALFPGVGATGTAASARLRALFPIGQILPALALAGAPLTSGALAKLYLKETTSFVTGSLPVATAVAALNSGRWCNLSHAAFLVVHPTDAADCGFS